MAGKRRRGKDSLVYGMRRSKPGEAPYKQTGRLQSSITWEVIGLVGRVGSNLPRARWLELGTRKVAARPWLRRAFNECRDQVKTIMGRGMKL